MNTKLTKAAAVTAALLPALGLAAIDDQGMQYVTAAEGLHGSLRVDILHSTDDDNNENAGLKGGVENSLRLWVIGTSDLGGGLASTYYWEVRSNKAGAKKKAVGTEAWDLGVTGPFGDVKFGKLGMVAPRLVPGASLAFERGSNREDFASNPGDNGLRWESPVFNGVKVGISAVIADKAKENEATDDDTVDEWSFAGKYDSPLGFSLGAGYEINKLPFGEKGTTSVTGDDDQSGFRFGARYGQDNWLVGYEYRGYKAFDPFSGTAKSTLGILAVGGLDTVTTVTMIVSGMDVTVMTPVLVDGEDVNPASLAYNDKTEYSVHAFGAQVKIDRITASANYSKEKQEFGLAGVNDLDRDTLALDAAYTLGSRSTVVFGWKQVDTETFVEEAMYLNGKETKSNKVAETYLFYRVDF